MSFSTRVKEELLKKNMSIEEITSFMDGFYSIAQEEGFVSISNQNIKKIIISILDHMKVKYKNNSKGITFINYKRTLRLKHPGFYFGGIFVARGSLSNPTSTSYHLEIQTNNIDVADEMIEFLKKYNINFKKLKRKTKTMIYLKSSTQILDFLKAIQAINAVLTFEDVMVSRDHKAMLNRWTNLDIYNQSKLVKANEDFRRMYRYVLNHSLESNFRDIELDFFELKMKNEYSSLEELSKIFKDERGISKTKSGLNHYLRKLKRVVKENNYI